MARPARKHLKMFGTSAGLNQRAKFGSFAAGSPAYETDVENIQLLSNWLSGWYSAVVGNNSPTIQDMNSLFYVLAYELCYIFGVGVPEWNTNVEYDIGSMVQDGAGLVYVSRANSNTGNALTDSTKWKKYNPQESTRTTTGTDTATLFDEIIFANPTSASFTQTLPASPYAGKRIVIKNIATNGNIVTVAGNGSNIDTASTFELGSIATMESATFVYTGSIWAVI